MRTHFGYNGDWNLFKHVVAQKCHHCKGMGSIRNPEWDKWLAAVQKAAIAAEDIPPRPTGEQAMQCSNCGGRGGLLTAEGIVAMDFLTWASGVDIEDVNTPPVKTSMDKLCECDYSGLSIRAQNILERLTPETRISDITMDLLMEQRNCGAVTAMEIIKWATGSKT